MKILLKILGEIKILRGKTVLVTGGAKGIGGAISKAFAKEGCNVVINYLNTNPKELMDEIESYGVKCLGYQGDISDFGEAKKFISTAKEEFDTIDVLVNNAGIAKDNLLIRMKEEQFDSVVNTNLKGTFNTIRHASEVMIKQRNGSIINITSVSGIMGNIGQANYSASKAGVIGLTKTVARELASRNITCNAIAPGFIETDMTNILQDRIKEEMLSVIPLKRFGDVEDIAKATVFLAASSYITGQVIQVNGGIYM